MNFYDNEDPLEAKVRQNREVVQRVTEERDRKEIVRAERTTNDTLSELRWHSRQLAKSDSIGLRRLGAYLENFIPETRTRVAALAQDAVGRCGSPPMMKAVGADAMRTQIRKLENLCTALAQAV